MKGIFIILLSLLFVSCWKSKITEGEVFKKEFKKAETKTKSYNSTQTRVRRGNTIVVNSYVTKRLSYPDRWAVYIHSKDLKDTADYYLHKEVYDSLKIGDWFVFDTIMGTAYEPSTEIK